MMDKAGLEERARSLIEDLLHTTPVFLVDFSVRGSRGSHAVDVFVESDDSLGVDRLAQLSREIGFVMDTQDVMPGPYTLNVSSPGADRSLQIPRQYRKHLGRDLRVHYRKDDQSMTEICGRLLDADDSAIQIQRQTGKINIKFEDILWAKVQLPW
ncbi:MAG: ribosome maturation factor RimP [Bacteroidetes bacterium]|nr:ribosome maturation factor RimP [Bacteroidota bacterium]MCY4224512.1 ribosome maturation factor RimP [Bacteroidota bacterium]